MAVTQYILNHDKLYHDTPGTKVLINDLVFGNMQNLSDDAILKSVMTIYNKNIFSTVPKCGCDEGGLEGAFYEGLVCENCGCVVSKPYESVKSETWLRSVFVDGVEIKFMNPIFYYELSKILSKKRKGFKTFNFLDYLLDTTVTIPDPFRKTDIDAVVEALIGEVLDGEHGYIPFTNKLRECLEFLANCSMLPLANRKKAESTLIMLDDVEQEVRNTPPGTIPRTGIFSTYTPILSNKFFVMEESAKGKFTNLKASMSLSIVKNWINLCKDIKLSNKLKTRPITLQRVGNTVAKIAKDASQLFIDIFNEDICKKPGIARKQVYGFKVGFSFRGVITSRPTNKKVISLIENGVPVERTIKKQDIKDYNEYLASDDPIDGIDVPWKAAVAGFEVHIINKLLKRGYSLKDIRRRTDDALVKYDSLIHEILLEILSEAPDGKMPIIGIRNPTLLRGSLMLMHIRSIKTNIIDYTFGISALVVKVFNGDYDGDNMSFQLVMDKITMEYLHGFRHEYALYSVNGPCEIEGFLTSLSTGNQVLANYLRSVLDDPNNDELYDMILANRAKQ